LPDMCHVKTIRVFKKVHQNEDEQFLSGIRMLDKNGVQIYEVGNIEANQPHADTTVNDGEKILAMRSTGRKCRPKEDAWHRNF